MLNHNQVEKVIFEALENLNRERDIDNQIEINASTQIFGGNSSLDSLSLVSLIVDVESEISRLTGFPISLTDDVAVSQDTSPYLNVSSLRDYILKILNCHG